MRDARQYPWLLFDLPYMLVRIAVTLFVVVFDITERERGRETKPTETRIISFFPWDRMQLFFVDLDTSGESCTDTIGEKYARARETKYAQYVRRSSNVKRRRDIARARCYFNFAVRAQTRARSRYCYK